MYICVLTSLRLTYSSTKYYCNLLHFRIQALKFLLITMSMMNNKKELTSQFKCLIHYFDTHAEKRKTKSPKAPGTSITASSDNVVFSIKYYSKFSNSLTWQAFGRVFIYSPVAFTSGLTTIAGR